MSVLGKYFGLHSQDIHLLVVACRRVGVGEIGIKQEKGYTKGTSGL